MKNQLLILFLFLALAGCTGDEEPFVAKNALYSTTFISGDFLSPETEELPKGSYYRVVEFKENGLVEYLTVDQDYKVAIPRQQGTYDLAFPKINNIEWDLSGTAGEIKEENGVYVYYNEKSSVPWKATSMSFD
jgi:hypothetical protein